MNILVIGAGATGQVFAWHLHLGGANITFLVRNHHRSAFESITQTGLPLYHLNKGKNSGAIYFKEFQVAYTIEEVKSVEWDQVWFSVPSNALDPSWIEEIANATSDATIVFLSPEGERRLEFEAKHKERILYGYITYIAWQSPLEGETISGPPGVAYWFPPLTSVPLRGPAERLKKVLPILKSGRMPVSKGAQRSTGGMVRLISSVLMPLVTGLECADWSFKGFAQSRWNKVVSEAAYEAYQVTSGKKGGAFGEFFFWMALNPFTLSVGLRISPLLMPFDFEKYMKFHFLKIRDQTKWILKGMLEDAEKMNLGVPNLHLLNEELK